MIVLPNDPTWPIGRSLVGGVSVGDEDDDDECDGSRVCEDSEGCIDGVGGGGKEKDSDCIPSVLGLSELPSGITTQAKNLLSFSTRVELLRLSEL